METINTEQDSADARGAHSGASRTGSNRVLWLTPLLLLLAICVHCGFWDYGVAIGPKALNLPNNGNRRYTKWREGIFTWDE